jgi:hypothetical protein
LRDKLARLERSLASEREKARKLSALVKKQRRPVGKRTAEALHE